jgi:Ras-related protein Rab-7A
MGCSQSHEVARLDTLQVNHDRPRSRQKRNVFKVVLLGDSSVGKTSLLRRFVRNDFSTDYKATIGADFLSKDVDVDGCKVTLQIWDTAGQERFHSLGVVFYRGAEACCLVCDVGDARTLQSLAKWRHEFEAANDTDLGESSQQQQQQQVVAVLLANKCDLSPDQRQLSLDALRSWWSTELGAKQDDAAVFETSALTGDGVERAFELLARRLLDR